MSAKTLPHHDFNLNILAYQRYSINEFRSYTKSGDNRFEITEKEFNSFQELRDYEFLE